MTVAFKTESWLWYGIVLSMVSLRFTSRILHFKSFLRFQIEDYLMLYLTCAYTTFIVLINISYHSNTNLIDPHDIPNLTPEDIAQRTFGSKVNIGVEQTMCMVQWGTKACLLFLYYRLTENLVQNVFVKAVGVYVTVTFIVMEILYLGYWCRPFTDFWQTPTDNVQCTTMLHHLIVNLSFNLTSDLLIMSIPLPLLIRARLEIKRKIIICFPFTLGFFSIICAALSKHVSFTHPFSPVWVYWYTREASCVMIVANMPYTWGLARRMFKLKSFWGRGSSPSEADSIDDETQDTGTETIGGETREIRGLEVAADGTISHSEKDEKRLTWKRFSGIFSSGKKPAKPSPTTTVDNQSFSEKMSPIVTQSDASTGEDQWGSVVWNKDTTEVQIVQRPALSPGSLMPPSPAVYGSNARRASTAESRRSSTAEIRRTNTHNSRRTRRSISELSRRSTRNCSHVDAIDRLYRLDDEDLESDLEAARPLSQSRRFD